MSRQVSHVTRPSPSHSLTPLPDLDSLCSALLFAYFRTHTPPHTLHIPLSNLPRADLALRPELNAVLNPAGLKPEDLVTLSDLCLLYTSPSPRDS